jgi:hypothetical protein
LWGRTFLRRWPYLRSWTFLGSWAFLWSLSYGLYWPLLGCWPHLLGRCCLLHRAFFLSPLDGGSGLLARLHRSESGLVMLYRKRLRSHDRLRLATVYGNELGAVCTGLNPVLLLDG